MFPDFYCVLPFVCRIGLGLGCCVTGSDRGGGSQRQSPGGTLRNDVSQQEQEQELAGSRLVRIPIENERCAAAAAAAATAVQQRSFAGVQTAGSLRSLRRSRPSASQSQTLRQDSSAGSFDPTAETRTSRFRNHVTMLAPETLLYG